LRAFAETQGLSDVGQLVRAMESNIQFSVIQSWL
jgi:hypothetical protein